MKSTVVYEQNVFELAHAPSHVRQDTLDQSDRMMMMKLDPLKHYDIMKRRNRRPRVEKYEDMKLGLGINDPSQTNNNLSKPGIHRRQRRIDDWEDK